MLRREFLKVPVVAGATLVGAGGLARGVAQTVEAGGAPVKSGNPLFFLPTKVNSLRARIAHDSVTKKRWEKMLRRADVMVSASIGAASEPDRQEHAGPGESSFVLGLAWRITGDERYARLLRKNLLSATTASRWDNPKLLTRTPPWNSGLATAGVTFTATVGLEALDGFLTISEVGEIRAAIKRLGVEPILQDWVLPRKRIHALDSMGHNWWSVCVSGAGVGALGILGSDPIAEQWLVEIGTALNGFFSYRGMVLLNKPANFDSAGGFYESVHYAGYALEAYLTFRLAQTNALVGPLPAIPVLEHVAGFFAHTLYPSSLGNIGLNFGDSSLRPSAAPAVRLLAILGYSPQVSNWYLDRVDPKSSDPIALLYLDDLTGGGHPPLPHSKLYAEMGWATLRDSWGEDATFLAVKSGFTWNHAHADAGSFVLYHSGVPILIDSGTCAYGRSEYTDYYRQSIAHNVVLFNGRGQPVEDFWERGVKFPGRLYDLLDGLGVRYLYADATGPMAQHFKRNYRHWIWIDDIIIIIDDIRSHEEGRFDWLLHYAGDAAVDGATVVVTNGRAKAEVVMIFPELAIVRDKVGLAPDAPNTKVKYLSLSAPKYGLEQKFITAILPVSAGRNIPRINSLQGKDAIGIRVTGGDCITELYFNLQSDGRRMHLNSNNVIAGWETDAYILGFTRRIAASEASAETVERYFAAGCSYLRRDGRIIIDCLSKLTAILQPGPIFKVLLQGQGNLVARFAAPSRPESVEVNGSSTRFGFDAATQTVEVDI